MAISKNCNKDLYRVIEHYRGAYPVSGMCAFFGISRPVYYAWRQRIQQPDLTAQRKQAIVEAYNQSKKTYGYRRIWMWLRQKRGVIIIVVIIILSLCACSPSAPVITSTPVDIPTKTPSETPEPTETIVPTPMVLNDPRIAELEKSGFHRVQLKQFVITANDGSTSFGGYDDTRIPQFTQGKFSYLQYDAKKQNNCILVFTVTINNQNRILSMIDASKINQRLKDATNDPIALLQCTPYRWGDINQNGKPDLPVSFEWANQYTGSEVHIFEVNNDLTISNLSADLPGIVSPWEFDPSSSKTELQLIDVAWANHDCIYPPIEIHWIYDWKDGKYVNITPELDLSNYIDEIKTSITAGFGKPIQGIGMIGNMTVLLLTYDHSGQRDKGWQEYLALMDMKNWPGTDENYRKWMQSDIEHFKKQYRAKQPFTPNDNCGWWKWFKP